MKYVLSALCTALLLAACADTPRMTQAERLEWYRANAGEPVRSFLYTRHIWRWTALGDRALAVWTRGNQGYLLEFFTRCPDLAFAHSISMTNRVGRVSAGFDSVTVWRAGATRTSASASTATTTARTARTGGTRCRIDTIRPINARGGAQESYDDMQDVEWEDRDPSVPEEPPSEPHEHQ